MNWDCHGLPSIAGWKNMAYNSFRIQIFCRVILLGVSLVFCAFLIIHTALYVTFALTGLLILFELFALLKFIEKSNRNLVRFLESIRYSDFSQAFPVSGDPSLDRLHAEFNRVMEEFHRARSEKEESFRYLETVVQHVGIGLLSFQPDGTVELMNNAAKRLLRVSHLKSVSSLASFSQELVDTLLTLKPGERKLVKITDNDEILHLAVYATGFMLREKNYTLVSIHNIQSELEEQEMKSWQNLIRVLTHEIMNSVTPIASLASTVNALLRDAGKIPLSELDPQTVSETAEDIKSAVETIQKRSEGLLHFVENYRNLTRIPKPDYRIFPVSGLFARVKQLMETRIGGKDISFTVAVAPETLELTADLELIEQVLINLLLNAIDAVGDRPESRIELRGSIDDRDRVIIQVSDNGPGIVGDVIDRIFIPFFTTKQNGSGIGLSLSRQIMRLHGGSIGVRSEPDIRTVFTLRF
ncbi:ATP-binding protein [bacterium]|nr:ATP-binding protein [bacterium]